VVEKFLAEASNIEKKDLALSEERDQIEVIKQENKE
jgi:hypothetical protein